MITTLSSTDIVSYLKRQFQAFFPDNQVIDNASLSKMCDGAYQRLEYNFKHINLKYYQKDSEPYFNHLHGDHYSMFLYLLSNEAYCHNELAIAEKSFALNKALHGIDCFYGVSLPKIFMFVHPVGSVIGNAEFSDYFVIYQNCTIGSTEEGIYPKFGEGCIVYSGTSVIGNCSIGNQVLFAANSFVINQDIKDNTTVLGQYPNNSFRSNKQHTQSFKFEL